MVQTRSSRYFEEYTEAAQYAMVFEDLGPFYKNKKLKPHERSPYLCVRCMCIHGYKSAGIFFCPWLSKHFCKYHFIRGTTFLDENTELYYSVKN